MFGPCRCVWRMLTKSRLLVPGQWTRLCPSPGSCSREVSSCLSWMTDGRRALGDPVGRSLLRGGTEGVELSPCVPLTLTFSCAVTYKSLVVLSYFLSLGLVFLLISSRVFCPFPLWVSGATCSTPEGPWQLRKFTSCFGLSTLSLASNHDSRSLCVISLLAASLSVTATQWQNRTLAAGAGLPVSAPPPLLPVPPPSL